MKERKNLIVDMFQHHQHFSSRLRLNFYPFNILRIVDFFIYLFDSFLVIGSFPIYFPMVRSPTSMYTNLLFAT